MNRFALLALAATLGATACNDYLTGGELSTDPNRPATATNRQLFVGVQTNIWSLLGGDPARIAGTLTQQWQGLQSQYFNTYTYVINEQTTNGAQSGLYAGGGLRDVRILQDSARAQGDTLMLGIAQVQEAMLMGTGADLFGDLVYTEALKGTPNPALTPQMAIYDSVQVLLSRAITNLSSYKGTATNLGPGGADLVYGGSKTKWIALAHTLKARFYLHTAEVRPTAYASALAEARQGITDPANDYKAIYSGNSGEQNLWYQFLVDQRFGYIVPGEYLINLMQSRNDPRIDRYFDVTGDVCGVPYYCTSYNGDGTGLLEEAYHQPLVTATEDLLIWAEAAQRTGATAEAVTELNAEKSIQGVPTVSTSLSGTALLTEILTEKYIALFESIEVWNDYKRTCWPNITPTVAGLKVPARLLYDAGERQTNSSIPPAQSQPTRNANDPANATDPTGARCLGQ